MFSEEEIHTEQIYNDITETEKKTFNINNPTNKKFQITNRRRVPVKDEKFNIINSSRPRSCPRCNSSGTIIKHNNRWKCSIEKGGCDFIW
ncbi:hypothetical protein KORDIASMS9_04662 [Kordia sp. SMS9]|uniref:hypothetical protein n=1 Tax=Kordia sp. SMS9 TaxID=2282170 RepID=UPI000E0D41D4|nr:hypothetical protein [Kordia sp. SMS9]AXG72390.1 hypothetical protein KORDIASMS9_04662 [Kordia sp. SMS9]